MKMNVNDILYSNGIMNVDGKIIYDVCYDLSIDEMKSKLNHLLNELNDDLDKAKSYNDVDWVMDIHLWILSIEFALYDGRDIDIIMESIYWGII